MSYGHQPKHQGAERPTPPTGGSGVIPAGHDRVAALLEDAARSEQHRNDLMDRIVMLKVEVGAERRRADDLTEMLERAAINEAQPGLVRMLIADNARMRAAGTALAEAGLRVIREYDGTHRLSLAVAEWAKAIANEGGRAERHASPTRPLTTAQKED